MAKTLRMSVLKTIVVPMSGYAAHVSLFVRVSWSTIPIFKLLAKLVIAVAFERVYHCTL